MLEPDDPRHGTPGGYSYHRCRCRACKDERNRYMRELRANGPKLHDGHPSSRGDANVVDSHVLSHFIELWVEEWHRERPVVGYPSDPVVGPMNWLAAETGINLRQLHRIVKCETPYTSLKKADEILTAIEQNFRLYNGDIEVMRSPYWSPEAWAKYMESRGCY